MELVKCSEYVIYREYDDTTVLFNVKEKGYAVINSIGSDIWKCIISSLNGVDVDSIANYISREYCTEFDTVIDDVCDFLKDLYYRKMITISDEYYDNNTDSNVSRIDDSQDIENEIIKICQQKNQLYSFTFELTYACNEKCIHCYAVASQDSNQKYMLTMDKCKALIDELYDMKCFHLIFTGGDPFVFRGALDLFKYARMKGFSFDIYTNGQVLGESQALADEISSLYPRTIYISLYGASDSIHDQITGINGSFDKTISAIKYLKAFSNNIVLNVMLMKPNHFEATRIINLAKELGVDYRIGISLIRKNNGDDSPLDYFIDDLSDIQNILRATNGNIVSIDANSDNEKTGLTCGAGTTALCLSPYGDVYPCVSLKRKLGSVFSQSIKDIWFQEERLSYTSALTWENTTKCKSCEYKSLCPHCIGISEAETGNPMECNYCDKRVAEALYKMYLNS